MERQGKSRSQNRIVGEFGEIAVVEFVRTRGATVIDRNWRIREGEIDIVGRLANGKFEIEYRENVL
jgi:Holliday junction resolvase-like predicted endonuclease